MPGHLPRQGAIPDLGAPTHSLDTQQTIDYFLAVKRVLTRWTGKEKKGGGGAGEVSSSWLAGVIMSRWAIAVLATLVCASSGCTASTAPKPAAGEQASARVDSGYTYRWLPNPAVDLMSPEGTFIRAVVESQDLAEWSDKKYLDAYEDGYPGYAHVAKMRLAPFLGGVAPEGKKMAGTGFYEVIGLERTATGYIAKLCHYGSRASGQDQAGNYYEPSGLGSGSTITFGPDLYFATAPQQAPLANQKGPARKPTKDVFGTWIVTDMAAVADKFPECLKLAPGTPAHQSLPAPALPPDPGWPE